MEALTQDQLLMLHSSVVKEPGADVQSQPAGEVKASSTVVALVQASSVAGLADASSKFDLTIVGTAIDTC